jgi:sugar/nucleoside kinase (ribokinase family)
MSSRKIKVSGVGCCLVDRIYDHVDFSSEIFARYMSRIHGDGGLIPGALEFEENLEHFAGRKFVEILPELTSGMAADKENIGGPCIVALINAAQMTCGKTEFSFYGCSGDDRVGIDLRNALSKTPVNLDHYRIEEGAETASTTVLSDPGFDDGHGERIFVNTIGASWKYMPEELDASFYDSDIAVFGGTALVPSIHKDLDKLLLKARNAGCLTIVNTVYDTLDDRANPGKRWPLGSSDEAYKNIDLLIADREEALHLSGCDNIDDALRFFREKGTKAAIVTNGSKNTSYFSAGGRFKEVEDSKMPVSEAVNERLRKGDVKGDTTGCGDNFVGGVIASLASQMYDNRKELDLSEACCWGTVCGGFACFYYGGTFMEKRPGEKLELMKPYYDAFLKQIVS